MLIETLQQQLRLSWSRETSYYREAWTAENPAWGQCAVTALIVQDVLGGEIISGIVTTPDEREHSHYWNRLNGKDTDLTWEQFPIPSIKQEVVKDLKGFPSLRQKMLLNSSTHERYNLLVQNMKHRGSFEF